MGQARRRIGARPNSSTGTNREGKVLPSRTNWEGEGPPITQKKKKNGGETIEKRD